MDSILIAIMCLLFIAVILLAIIGDELRRIRKVIKGSCLPALPSEQIADDTYPAFLKRQAD